VIQSDKCVPHIKALSAVVCCCRRLQVALYSLHTRGTQIHLSLIISPLFLMNVFCLIFRRIRRCTEIEATSIILPGNDFHTIYISVSVFFCFFGVYRIKSWPAVTCVIIM
jgi:hypothetical protein